MDATSLISEFGQAYQVTRYAQGAYVNGVYIPGAKSTFDVVLSLQPVTGKELLNLPEGQRGRTFMKGYSPVALFTVEQSPSAKADLVSFMGRIFEVQQSEVWVGDFDHWKILVAEVNPGAVL